MTQPTLAEYTRTLTRAGDIIAHGPRELSNAFTLAVRDKNLAVLPTRILKPTDLRITQLSRPMVTRGPTSDQWDRISPIILAALQEGTLICPQ